MTDLVGIQDQDLVRLLFHLFQSSLLLSSPSLSLLLLLSVFIFNFYSQITQSHLLLSFTITQAQPRDRHFQFPIDSLPSEIFCHVISFLQPRDVANASAVSSKWRKVINSNAELHDEIDLLNVSEITKSKEKMIHHFKHLSARCNHKPVKVSLDLTRFFFDSPIFSTSRQDFPVALLDLDSALVDSCQSLKEIKLVVERIEGQDQAKVWVIPFMSGFIKKFFEDCPKLQKVWIEIPTWYTFKAGVGSKQVFLSNNSPERYRMSLDSEFDLLLFNDVKGFTQSGFTELKCVDVGKGEISSSEEEPEEDPWANRIFYNAFLNGLSDSTSSLKALNLSCVYHTSYKELWDFAMKCENLSSLTLHFYQGEEIIQFEVPKRMNKKSELKKVHIQLYKCHEVDWEDLSKWIGDELEDMVLRVEGSSGLILPLIFNRRDTLKRLDLTDLAPSEHDFPVSQTSRFFSKLELLFLERVNMETIDFFSTLISPKIEAIGVLRSSSTQVETPEYLRSSLKLFRNHSQNLFQMALGYRIGKGLQAGKEFSNLTFPKLQFLALLGDGDSLDDGNSLDDDVVELFSTFVYPHLRKLELSNQDLQVKFQKNSPKLKLE